MFCGKCGAKNADNAKVCSGCGAKLSSGQTIGSGLPITTNPNDKNRKIGIITIVIIVAIIIVAAITLFGGRSYKTTVEKFVNAQLDADVPAIFKLIPEKMIDYVLKEEGYNDDELDKLIDEANESMQDQIDYIERNLGEDWEASYEILNVESVTGNDLNDLKDDYKDMEIKVSTAKTVEVQLTIKAGETESSNSIDVPVIKVGRSWYLDLGRMASIF